jgi:undecaprenyl-diphosphatase
VNGLRDRGHAGRAGRALRQAREWLRARSASELYVLAALLAGVLCVWGFVELADEVLEGGTQRLDEEIVRRLRKAGDPRVPIGPQWLAYAARDATALGGYTILALVVAAAAGFCAVVRRYGTLVLVLVAAIGGAMLSAALKGAFARPRPDVVPHLMEAAFSSFPSGHAMMSSAVYMSLAAVLAQIIPGNAGKLYVLGVALLLTGLVGVTRVFVGVHYPTDVLAGWAAGLAWAMLCWVVARALRRRRIIRERQVGSEQEA